MERLSELIAYPRNRQSYRTRTERLIEIVQQIEVEGQFPKANYVFDSGVCAAELTQVIEQSGKHWVSEVACNRSVLWSNQWRRIDAVAADLGQSSRHAFRCYEIRQRNGEQKTVYSSKREHTWPLHAPVRGLFSLGLTGGCGRFHKNSGPDLAALSFLRKPLLSAHFRVREASGAGSTIELKMIETLNQPKKGVQL
jgi:hypothetical protein